MYKLFILFLSLIAVGYGGMNEEREADSLTRRVVWSLERICSAEDKGLASLSSSGYPHLGLNRNFVILNVDPTSQQPNWGRDFGQALEAYFSSSINYQYFAKEDRFHVVTMRAESCFQRRRSQPGIIEHVVGGDGIQKLSHALRQAGINQGTILFDVIINDDPSLDSALGALLRKNRYGDLLSSILRRQEAKYSPSYSSVSIERPQTVFQENDENTNPRSQQDFSGREISLDEKDGETTSAEYHRNSHQSPRSSLQEMAFYESEKGNNSVQKPQKSSLGLRRSLSALL